jgi:hypothetical protein
MQYRFSPTTEAAPRRRYRFINEEFKVNKNWNCKNIKRECDEKLSILLSEINLNAGYEVFESS